MTRLLLLTIALLALAGPADAQERDVVEGSVVVPDSVPTLLTAEDPPAVECEASYPDLCISSPPPDLDCGDLLERRFRVVGDDPHRLDGDRDGIACES